MKNVFQQKQQKKFSQFWILKNSEIFFSTLIKRVQSSKQVFTFLKVKKEVYKREMRSKETEESTVLIIRLSLERSTFKAN